MTLSKPLYVGVFGVHELTANPNKQKLSISINLKIKRSDKQKEGTALPLLSLKLEGGEYHKNTKKEQKQYYLVF